MARSRTDRSDLRRFGIAVAVFSLGWLVLGLLYSEDIALVLQRTPTTKNGWLFIGWLVGGPPYALTVLLWFERRRFSRPARTAWTIVLAFWIGLSFFIGPARIIGPDEHFGTAALVGFPLSFGWVWGTFSAALVAAVAGISVLVLSLTVEPRRARELLTSRATRTVLERLWLVALVVALGIALYGGEGKGIFNNGI
ncbi:MAG: hypothetical protein NTV23_07060 [Propionibacteriales bacterium]|nr:hypothetical protein [Propionibacteriales bacterium]